MGYMCVLSAVQDVTEMIVGFHNDFTHIMKQMFDNLTTKSF